MTRAERRQQSLIRSILTSWHDESQLKAALRAAEATVRAKASNSLKAMTWGSWRGAVIRRRELVPAVVAEAAARRSRATAHAALLGWCEAAAAALDARRMLEEQLTVLQRHRTQRLVLAALGQRVAEKQLEERRVCAACACAGRRMTGNCMRAWRAAVRQRTARDAAVDRLAQSRSLSRRKQLFDVWASMAEQRRRHKQREARMRRRAAARMQGLVLAAWRRQALVRRMQMAAAGSLVGKRRMWECWRAWREGVRASEWQVQAAARVWDGKLLRGWLDVVKERKEATEQLKTCLRRKRVAFRTFKRCARVHLVIGRVDMLLHGRVALLPVAGDRC